MTKEVNENRLIHIGKILRKNTTPLYFFLRERTPNLYEWVKQVDGKEEATEINAESIELALFKANKAFKDKSFTFINCGFRYTLPERDECGTNALFFQMKASYKTSNGVYFDEILGNNCVVQFASLEALQFLNLN